MVDLHEEWNDAQYFGVPVATMFMKFMFSMLLKKSLEKKHTIRVSLQTLSKRKPRSQSRDNGTKFFLIIIYCLAEFSFPFQVLVLFNSCENDFSQRLADEIIEWGTELLENDTFARLDYLELLELTIFFWGGSVYPFSPSKASWFNFLIINFA